MYALEINNLKKQYSDGKIALNGVSFHVRQGDFFALLGPNGAGKSTLINILVSLVQKTSGTVRICGCDIDEDFSRAKSFIGVVPQEINFSIFEAPMNILVNQAGYYGVPRSVALGRAEKYLKQLALWEKRHAMSRSLSGGMKRRLMIARALMNEPSILILDEPTAGVDIELRHDMWRFLTDLNNEGVTIILTTHYLEEAEHLCKNLAIINHGALIENMTMSEIQDKVPLAAFRITLDKALPLMGVLSEFHVVQEGELTFDVSLKKNQTIHQVFLEIQALGGVIKAIENKTKYLEELFISATQSE